MTAVDPSLLAERLEFQVNSLAIDLRQIVNPNTDLSGWTLNLERNTKWLN